MARDAVRVDGKADGAAAIQPGFHARDDVSTVAVDTVERHANGPEGVADLRAGFEHQRVEVFAGVYARGYGLQAAKERYLGGRIGPCPCARLLAMLPDDVAAQVQELVDEIDAVLSSVAEDMPGANAAQLDAIIRQLTSMDADQIVTLLITLLSQLEDSGTDPQAVASVLATVLAGMTDPGTSDPGTSDPGTSDPGDGSVQTLVVGAGASAGHFGFGGAFADDLAGSQAAAVGGYTAVLAMANTHPVTDTAEANLDTLHIKITVEDDADGEPDRDRRGARGDLGHLEELGAVAGPQGRRVEGGPLPRHALVVEVFLR